MAKITLRQVVDAMRKNGLPQGFGSFFQDTPTFVDSRINDVRQLTPENIHACALGQAAFNLDVDAGDLLDAIEQLDDVEVDGRFLTPHVMVSDIISLNDDEQESLPNIADYLEERYGPILDTSVMTLRRVRTRYARFKNKEV